MTHSLHSCPACAGFLSPAAALCPHCDAPARPSRGGRLARAILGMLGSGAAAVTLMACYGGGAMHMRPNTPVACADGVVDSDHDGQCPPADCNNDDPMISPLATEASDSDGIDQNCDGADGVAEPVPVPPGDGEPVDPVDPVDPDGEDGVEGADDGMPDAP
jgi:hypothetical protein